MSNDAILILDENEEKNESPRKDSHQEYLTVSGSLKEIADAGTQALAQANLSVYSKNKVDELVTRLENAIEENKTQAGTKITSIEQDLENISQTQDEFVKLDGTTPFESIQEGITPPDSNEDALVTVKYILNKLRSYLTATKISETIQNELAILDQYALLKDVYKKGDTYSQAQIDSFLKTCIKSDGSIPFKNPQEGQYPKLRTHLSTKGYTDDAIKQHKNELDPHNFQTILAQKLSNYYQKSETYTKAQTYSRLQIDSIIDKLVSQACKNLIEEHINTIQHLTSQEVQQIIKLYAAANLLTKEDWDNELVKINSQIEESMPIWRTSGPVETTVGFVEDNTEVPSEMTLQEIMDAIFYGRNASINIPDSVNIGESCDITVCVHGTIGLVEYAELWQGNELIYTFHKEDFQETGCITVQSHPIYDDTEFTFKVHYSNGAEVNASDSTKCSYPMFIGLLPKWKPAYTISMEYLQELSLEDSFNNKFLTLGDELSVIYNFKDPNLRHFFAVIPVNYNYELDSLTTKSQSFNEEAFDIIDMIPFRIKISEEISKDIIYSIYVFKQAQAFAENQKVTFNFKSKKQ